MNRETIQQLRQLPVEGVAERLGLRVTRHKSLCPFHDDHHASLTFNVRRNTYRCFACDAHGGTIDLVMRHLHKDFPDACRWLADSTNIIVEEYRPQTPSAVTPLKPFDALRYAGFFERPWLSDEARRFLFEERGIDRRVVRWCRLTSWTDRHGTHWLQTPYYDTEWRLTGMQSRNLDYGKAGSAADVPRFRFPYGSRCSVYNLPVTALLREGEPLYITEGCSDCWAMLSAGHKAVAIPSATLLSEADKGLLRGLAERLGTTFHMFPDRDAPGERLFMQLREVLPGLCHHQLAEGAKDFGEMFATGRIADNKVTDYFRSRQYHESIVTQIMDDTIQEPADERAGTETSVLGKLSYEEMEKMYGHHQNKEWETFRLKVYEGYTFGEISANQGVDLSTVKSRYYAMVKRVRKEWDYLE